MEVFDTLFGVNVNERTEKKKVGGTDLTYLSWSYAWAEVKKRFPNTSYEIKKFDGLPYVYDPKTGYMVYTTVTIEGVTHEMWLPVMDGANKAMKSEPYEYTTGYGQYQKTKVCEAATMMDINKTIMRCLVKNLAMFGLGLYIFAGEDLPEGDAEEEPADKKKKYNSTKISSEEARNLETELVRAGGKVNWFCDKYKVRTFKDLTPEQMLEIYGAIDEQNNRNKGTADSTDGNDEAGRG